jgi:hypothetical protein
MTPPAECRVQFDDDATAEGHAHGVRRLAVSGAGPYPARAGGPWLCSTLVLSRISARCSINLSLISYYAVNLVR